MRIPSIPHAALAAVVEAAGGQISWHSIVTGKELDLDELNAAKIFQIKIRLGENEFCDATNRGILTQMLTKLKELK